MTGPFSRTCGAVGCIWMLLIAAGSSVRAAEWWDPNWTCVRKVLVQETTRERPGEEAVYVEFTTGGYLQPSGADLRVLTLRGESVPYSIIHIGPGDRVSLLFKFLPRHTVYYIYYGNPACSAPKTTWTPQRGLILSTYRFGPVVKIDNWMGMQETVKAAGTLDGRGLVEKVWHGCNPFGPSRNMISVYTGWINPLTDGKYLFATTSAAASYLLVDGKLVTQWGGWHGPVADARFKGEIELKAGLHAFAYYHAQGEADPIMVAAWQPPLLVKPEVIPPGAFLPPLKGEVMEYRIRDAEFAPDFAAANVSEAVVGERWLITLSFSDTSFPRTAKTTRREWDFGDGLTGEGPDPQHVYLAPGVYTATIRVFRGDARFEGRQRIVVDRDWPRQQTLKPEALEAVAKRISDYRWEALAAPCLYGALLLYEEMKRPEDILKVGAPLLDKLRDLTDEDERLQAAVIVGTTLRDKDGKPEAAVKVFREADSALTRADLRARLGVQVGDTLFYHLNRPVAARAEYERVCKEFPDAAEYVRLALLRLGDVARADGNSEEARYFYGKSADLRPARAPGRWTMEVAMRALEADDLLRRNELEAAEAALYSWQWQDPEEKLRGRWSATYIRLSIARANWAEARKEAEIILRANPESQYVPEILLLLSEIRTNLKDTEGARKALEQLKRDYPDSPLVPKADALLNPAEAAPKKSAVPGQ